MSSELQNPYPGVFTKTTPRPAPDGMGTGIFATADISLGEDVLNIKVPFAAVLDTERLTFLCSGCFGMKNRGDLSVTSETVPRACSGCRAVRYCDKACQVKDWKFAHSLECPIYKKLYPRVLPHYARAILRVLLRSEREKYSKEEFDMFLKLGTHMKEIRDRAGQTLEQILDTGKAIHSYSGTDKDEQTIQEYVARVEMNAFTLTTAVNETIGVYFHPYAGLINHQCDFNAVQMFDGDELFIKPIRPIKKDEQIFISYCDPIDPVEVRRNTLAENYFFECKCSKCEQDTNDSKEFSSTVEDMASLRGAEQRANALFVSSMHDSDGEISILKLQRAMHILTQSAWPITRQPYVGVRNQLILCYINTGQWASAFVQCMIRYLRIDPVMYPEEIHPLRYLHAFEMVKLGLLLTDFRPTSEITAILKRANVAIPFITWSVVDKLFKIEKVSCAVPGLKAMVRELYEQADMAFHFNRTKLGTKERRQADKALDGQVVGEWKKMEEVVSQVLEREAQAVDRS